MPRPDCARKSATQSISVQPAVDAVGNVLLWNGEVFGGQLGAQESAAAAAALTTPTPGPEENDTDAVLAALGADEALADPDAVRRHCRAALSGVAGPWALVYLHRASSTLHFGRDRLGRRSLCLIEDPGYVHTRGWILADC